MHNIRDWCISRQLWWGHRVPVWSKEIKIIDKPHGLGHLVGPLEAKGEAVRITADGKSISSALGSLRSGERVIVSIATTDEAVQKLLEKEGFQQDPDVLDTWASSWLWPFATMGWPEQTETLKKFYPTTDLVTAPEIIFFWVARMI